MPSLPDTAVIIFLGLLLFGPKGLAQIARQLGKLMGEFRRASNEFRMQMEEELRIAEQADRQKEIAAIESAAPPVAALPSTPADELTDEHPHLSPSTSDSSLEAAPVIAAPAIEPLPIASSGDLSIMPPATGLPQPRSSSLAASPLSSSSLSSLIDAVPKVDPPGIHMNGTSGVQDPGEDQRPMRYTDHDASNGTGHTVAAEESLHG